MASTDCAGDAAAACAFFNSLRLRFDDPTLSDITITCAGRSWHCHKIILCSHSDWFNKACTNGFKETSSRTLTLEEDDPDAIHALIEYCYKLSYTTPPAYKSSPITFDVKVFAAAEKYLMPQAQQYAVDCVHSHAEESSTNMDDKVQGLALVDYDGDLAPAVRSAYTETVDPERALRKTLMKIVMLAKKELLAEGSEYKVFGKMMEETPQFAAEVSRVVFEASMRAWPEVKRYYCANSIHGRTARCYFYANISPNQFYQHICASQGASSGMKGHEWEYWLFP